MRDDRNNGEKTVGWDDLGRLLASADVTERPDLVSRFLTFARCW